MANKIFNTRIQSKYDTLANWTSANPVLLSGEIAVVVVPAMSGTVVKEPAVLFKVGDGATAFNDLGFVSATSADVYDWAKASAKPVYAATEITGLGDAISQYVSDTMGITTDTNTVYKIEATEDGAGVQLFAKAANDPDTSWAKTTSVSLTAFVKKIEEGTANGTIKVDGTDVAVHGLGSAAFVDTTAFDASGKADEVKTAIETKIGTVAENKTVVGLIEEAKTAAIDAATYDDSALSGRIKTLEDDTRVATLIGTDTGKSARTIANEELAKQLIPEGAKEALDTLGEIAAWIQQHPDDASAMNQKIAALETAVGEGGSVGTQIDNKIAALKLDETYDAKGAAATAEASAKAYVDGKASDYDPAGSATSALNSAKAYADSLAGNYDASGAATTAETNAKAYADELVANKANWDKAQENVIEKITVNGTEVAPVNKTVAITVKTDIKDLDQTEYVVFNCGSATLNI